MNIELITILDFGIAIIQIHDMFNRIEKSDLERHLNKNLGEGAVEKIQPFLLMDNAFEVRLKSEEYATLLKLKYG